MIRRHRQQGFTFIELVIVITILGVLAGILTPFIQHATTAYAQSRIRNTLLTIGDLSLERMTRSIRQAVPNSITVLNGDQGIEFLHARTGGRYVDQFDNFGAAFADPAARLAKATPVDRIYILGTGLSKNTGDVLVIGNTAPSELTTGSSGSAVALNTVLPTAALPWPLGDGTDQGQIMILSGNHAFPIDSPGRHFLIADRTIEIGKSGTTLRWHSNSGLNDLDADTDWSGSDPILVDQVRSIHFSFQPGTPRATGVVRIDLELADAGDNESLRLYREVHIRNTP